MYKVDLPDAWWDKNTRLLYSEIVRFVKIKLNSVISLMKGRHDYRQVASGFWTLSQILVIRLIHWYFKNLL
jgi:hypothetical protein